MCSGWFILIGHRPSSVCLPLGGGHCGVRVSVHLVCMRLHSVHLVGMGLGLGISGVKKSSSGFHWMKSNSTPQVPLLRTSVHLLVNNFFENLKIERYCRWQISCYLTHYHTMQHFDALTICSREKHRKKKEKLLVTSNFSFLTMFSTLPDTYFHFKCTLKCSLQFGIV